MSAPVFRVDSIADAYRYIALLAQTDNAHRIPIVQATIDRRICHQEFNRTSPARQVKLFLAAAGRQPAVVLLGDDDDEPSGPAGWACARRLLDWADLLIVHGTGGEREHYEAAVEATQTLRRVLFVETTSDLAPAWIEAARLCNPLPALRLHLPQPGASHPVPDTVPPVLQ